ncbi:MAG: hypothetical protein K0S32_2181 [Bacteroidetes bacterium]|jgi:FkbM family methyltransferase|nr:hypothetical protein [Bacteroidota bacterium]
MRLKIILILKYIHRFGFVKGCAAYMKNYTFTGSDSTISLRNYIGPVHLRKNSSDIQTFDQVLVSAEYDYVLNFRPQFIIDCGANIGLATLHFKTKFPEALVVAVEPESTNFEMLKKNTAAYKNTECIKAGIWTKNAILKAEDVRNFGNWGFVCKEVDKEDETTIRAVCIDEIMKRYGKDEIDLLKIDIEGTELELFSTGYEAWLPKTKVIMIELHDAYRKGCSKSFFNAVLKYDFSVFHRGENIVCIKN